MYNYGDRVEYLAFGNVWKEGTIYAVFQNKIVVYTWGLGIGTDLIEVRPDQVRKPRA